MDFDLGRYVTQYYFHFATEAGREESNRLIRTLKGSSDPNFPAALERWEAFQAATGARILRDHADEIFLNRCPKCGALAATPRARQCRRCYYTWHHLAERGQPPRGETGP